MLETMWKLLAAAHSFLWLGSGLPQVWELLNMGIR